MNISHVVYTVLLMLLAGLVVDGTPLRRRSTAAHPGRSSSPCIEPWLQPCGAESDVPGRFCRSNRSRSYWQRVFTDLESMAGSMVEIANDTVTDYVSLVIAL